MLHCEHVSLSRRRLMGMSGALAASAFIPSFARAAGGRDPRLIAIVLRGAMDGLCAVAPTGDPDYANLHGDLALEKNSGIAVDTFFTLNPALKNFARLYQSGQAAVIHAVATGYRERSHFDGQDVLESGYAGPGSTDSGWLNRAIGKVPAGDPVNKFKNLAVGTTSPLIIRGEAETLGWAPANLPRTDEDLTARLLDLYQHTDPRLAQLLDNGLKTDSMAGNDSMGQLRRNDGGAMVAQARGAAKLMAADDGPRIAAMAFDGWDTHQNEGGARGKLFNLLEGLDCALSEFEKGLDDAWKQTAIVVVTEFGRTVRVNGTEGTDHGTGTVAFLAGGAIKGGRIISDWPGLKDAQLHEGRDLKPTTDLRSMLKGVLADHLGLSATVLTDVIFPESSAIKPMKGLIAA